MIRALDSSDYEALCALDAACFDVAWQRAQIAEELRLPDACALGYFVGDELQGALLARLVMGELWIFRIMTLPAHRRQGIAAKLLAGAKERAPSVPMWLEVSVENHAARAFYEREGFALVSRRPGYYQATQAGEPAVDALVMKREPA